MSNFYCEDDYMNSTRYYDEDHSWEEQGYRVPQGYYDEEPSWDDECYEVDAPPRRYYDENQLWCEQGYEEPQYDMPNYYEDPNFPKRTEEPSTNQLLAQILASQEQQRKEMQHLSSEVQQSKATLRMLETQIAQQASIEVEKEESLTKDKEESNDEERYEVNKIDERGRGYTSPSMNEEEEEGCVGENMKMEVATHQHVQTFEAHDPSSTYLEYMNLDHETKKALAHLNDDFTLKEFLAILARAYYDHDETSCIEEEQVSVDSPKDEDFFSDDSCMEVMLGKEHDGDSYHISPSDHLSDGRIEVENVEPPKDQRHHDFVEIYMDPILEETCLEVGTSSKEHFEEEAPKIIIEKLEESVPIELDSVVEDPFFSTLPQDKFQSFLPFISRSFGQSFYNPLHLKEINCKKDLITQKEVPRKLGGREYKWDFKLDKLQVIHCTA